MDVIDDEWHSRIGAAVTRVVTGMLRETTMTAFYQILTYFHVATGAIALVVFWMPIVVRKGSALHVRTGRWFARAMYAVSLSAMMMSAMLLLVPGLAHPPAAGLSPEEMASYVRQYRVGGLFLMLLSVLVFASVRQGLLALAARRDPARIRSTGHRALIVTLGALGLASAVTGIRFESILLIVFGLFSIYASVNMMRVTFRAHLSPHEWVIEHFGGIMGAGIGAYTAFFVFGGRTLLGSLLDGNWILVPWLAPTVIGITAISWLTRRHRARFDPGERTDPAPRELARLPQRRS